MHERSVVSASPASAPVPTTQQHQQNHLWKKYNDNKMKFRNLNMNTVIACFIVGGICFYGGIVVGINIGYYQAQDELDNNNTNNNNNIENFKLSSSSRSKVRRQEQQQQQQQQEEVVVLPDEKVQVGNGSGSDMVEDPRFAQGFKSFISGMSYVSRDEFAKSFDMGVPLDKTNSVNNNVLILHSDPDSLPTSYKHEAGLDSSSHKNIPFINDVDTAVENCGVLNIILSQPNRKNQCLAIMGQYNSYHIQKFMRLSSNMDEIKKGIQSHHPLRLVNRNAQTSGRLSIKVPSWKETEGYWKSSLSNYLSSLDEILDQLRPIAEDVVDKKTNSIIVMVCNFGQVDLLVNFICSCKAKGFDLSNLLVFATDKQTKNIIEKLGHKAFYAEQIFDKIPKKAAKRYADRTFAAVMMAKVYCVQLINVLGYDVLFQDADVLWYRNPIDFFANDKSQFDMYFQDDGNHGQYYAPYSANTGFYYVRYNDRTRYFFTTLLLTGDLIVSTKSHQIALISLLNEHASMYGLRIKILSLRDGLFPGGATFHRDKSYMKDLLQQKYILPSSGNSNNNNNNGPKSIRDENQYFTQQIITDENNTSHKYMEHPYIFHMSWTHNKDNKKNFFEQMGQWFVDESKHICLAEASFICHYKDKPSLKPCTDSPPIDDRGRSFW